MSVQIALADVAARAGVSVQTVLRHFGSRDNLFEHAWARHADTVRAERATPVGDVEAAVAAIVSSYERLGDWSIRLQAVEHSDDLARRALSVARRFHRSWVEEVFAPQLAARTDRKETTDLLVVATDVLTWKILRRDQGLGQRATCRRMRRLVQGILRA